MTTSDSLNEAFLEDHRHLTQGLSRLRDAVSAGEVGQAVELARQLDTAAGPHIDFEEEAFYPVLRGPLGDASVDQLYREHADGQKAIRLLLAKENDQSLSPPEQSHLLVLLATVLDHAVSCGTLLSHVSGLSEEERETMLQALVDRRKRGRRWSELPGRGVEAPPPAGAGGD